MDKILGRHKEIELFQSILRSNVPEFLAVYGRRRVGKTFLIRNYFSNAKDVMFFDATGSKNTPMSDQIENFMTRIGEVFYNGLNPAKETKWKNVFKALTDAMRALPKEKKIILFFDEFPWMVTPKSRLLGVLDYFWNQYWSKDDRVKLIICGSSASWIIDNIINNKGGLHNRITQRLLLEPLTLNATKKFLTQTGFKITNKQVVDLYMVTGGIPYYLTKFRKDFSVPQNIEHIAFKKNAFLLGEFDNLFSSLFEKADIYIDIIRFIAKSRYGTSQEEIFSTIKEAPKGGETLKKLKALEEAGFIKSFKPFSHQKRGLYYRVVDEFTSFYLQWIEPLKQTLFSQGVGESYLENEMRTPRWMSWAGYAFESVCYKHLVQIIRCLNISPASLPHTWRYVPRSGSPDRGAQIDLLFDRPDNAITLCEIKYSYGPYTLDKEYIEILHRKAEVFQTRTKTQKQIFMAIIASHGLKNNFYTDQISNVVTLEDLFKD
jgi:AAA+ ATPase superfamily predicted ATPase